MCKGCHSQAKLRDTPLEPEEIAKLVKARRTTDLRKLAAMMPAWLKRHVAAYAIPKREIFDPRTVVPFAGISHSDPRIGYYFPGGQVAQKRVKGGPLRALPRTSDSLMYATDTVAEYVSAFCKMNNLTGAAAA